MRCLRFIFLFICLAYLNGADALTPRYSAIVIEANSGKVLEQEGADRICHPASLTKMMTLYIVFEALKSGRIRMNTQIPISVHAARQIPSKLGLRPGESVTVDTIIKGLVTKSANDASAAIAEYLGGNEPSFARMMTRKAKSLGMRSTIFKNASGVPHSQQITTARDMATLSRSLYLHYPKDYRYFRLKVFHHRNRTHINHNHLLGRVRGLDGIKTGWVAASGFNLAASAVRIGPDNKPRRLIAVVLGGPNRRWRDQRVASLLEANFQRIGMERSPSMKYNDENDDDDEDAEVDAFLKQEILKAKGDKDAAPRPISMTWPAPKARRQRGEAKDSLSVRGQEVMNQDIMRRDSSLPEAKIRPKKALSILKPEEISLSPLAKGRKIKKFSYKSSRLLGISRKETARISRKPVFKGKQCRIGTSYG